jgi:hypothetical protein
MKKLLFIIVIFLVLLAAAGWYLLKPKTLGISYTPKDLEQIKQKLGVTFAPLPVDAPAAKTIIVSGAHPVDQTFTSAELTALVSNRRHDYAYFPFRHVQIRVNSDGKVEGSGTINYQDAVNYLLTLGVSQKDIAEAAAKYKIPHASLPVYLKASGAIINNDSQINFSAASIANINVPESLIKEFQPAVNSLIESVIKSRQPSYNIEKLEVVNGQVHFTGTAPDVEMAAKSIK